jgi:hypothetical protein
MTVEHARPRLAGTPAPMCEGYFCSEAATLTVYAQNYCCGYNRVLHLCERTYRLAGRHGKCVSCKAETDAFISEPVSLRVATER